MGKVYYHKKEIEIPIYRGALVILITNDIDKVKVQLPDFDDDDIYAHTILDNWNGKQGFIVILNFNNDYRGITNGTITHEAIHAAHMILEQRDVIPDFINDEPIAYLAEWITDEIYKFLKSKKIKPKY